MTLIVRRLAALQVRRSRTLLRCLTVLASITSPPTKPSSAALGIDAQDDDDNPPPAPDLEAKLTAGLHRAELAEQKADLLEQQVGDMRAAMRMLEAGPQRRRRWFRSPD